MNDNELRSLLRDAEVGIERPKLVTADLAGVVRREDRRRRQRTQMLLAALPVIVFVGITAAWLSWPNPAALRVDERVANVRFDVAEVERLEAEARFHERVARQLIAGQKRDRARDQAHRSLTEPDPQDELREQVDVVAYRMIQRADALRTETDRPTEAIHVYRKVGRLFPTTYSAELARTRLNELGISNGET